MVHVAVHVWHVSKFIFWSCHVDFPRITIYSHHFRTFLTQVGWRPKRRVAAVAAAAGALGMSRQCCCTAGTGDFDVARGAATAAARLV